MSLYNQLMSANPIGAALLAVINLHPAMIARLRDVSIWDEGESILVFTRTGGGNREEYAEQNAALQRHPLYKRDVDSTGDSTYAEFYFKVPEEFQHKIKELSTDPTVAYHPMERFTALIAKLEKGDESDPEVQRALAVGEKIIGKLNEKIESGEGGIIEV